MSGLYFVEEQKQWKGWGGSLKTGKFLNPNSAGILNAVWGGLYVLDKPYFFWMFQMKNI